MHDELSEDDFLNKEQNLLPKLLFINLPLYFFNFRKFILYCVKPQLHRDNC